MRKRISLLIVLLLFFKPYAFADEFNEALSGFDEEFSEELSGFEESVTTEIGKYDLKEKNTFSLSGKLSLKSSYGYKKHEVDGSDYSGFNQAQTSFYLQYDTRLDENWKLRLSADVFYDVIYDLRSDEEYRKSVQDDYKEQLRLDDTYLQGRLSEDMDLKLGRQVVVWGKSDTIRVTDVINPLDNRFIAMTDIEDLRLSTTMMKVDYYFTDGDVSVMLIPENRIMTEATPRGEYFPVDEILAIPGGVDDPFPKLSAPSWSMKNMQYALSVNRRLDSGDISLYAAEVLDQRWHFQTLPQIGLPLSERKVDKIRMFGFALNHIVDSWLFKTEWAYLDQLHYNTTANKKKRLDALIGLEYMGFKHTVISLDTAVRHIFSHEQQMRSGADMVDKNELETALRISRDFAHETFTLNALAMLLGDSFEKGGFVRLWGEYEIMDAVSAELGVVDYISGERAYLDAISNNDRIFLDISYSF